ncbi:MAG: cytochrome b/b6 domain-containing protein [Spongiibacteraceae bacterium]
MANTENSKQPAAVEQRLVWDLPVRIFHWTLVLAVAVAYVTHWLGISYFKYHVWSGYVVLVLVTFRLLWGLVGTRHARFWNFVRGPVTTLRYGRDWLRGREPHFAGHNPLGAVMVIVLLLTLFAQALFGLFGNDEIFNVGPLYAYASNELSLQLTSLHRQLFYWIAGAIGLHILAVLAHYLFKRERLVRAMITGRKPKHKLSDFDGIHSSRAGLAAVLVIALVTLLAWLVNSAPLPVADLSY